MELGSASRKARCSPTAWRGMQTWACSIEWLDWLQESLVGLMAGPTVPGKADRSDHRMGDVTGKHWVRQKVTSLAHRRGRQLACWTYRSSSDRLARRKDDPIDLRSGSPTALHSPTASVTRWRSPESLEGWMVHPNKPARTAHLKAAAMGPLRERSGHSKERNSASPTEYPKKLLSDSLTGRPME
jgi:hypothetical protein